MSIIGIVAVDRNGAIGKGGSIPWHYSADLKFFKRQTLGNVCVMGRRTWLSLKRPLKDRLNIVLSRTSEVELQESVVVLRERASVLSLKSYLSCDIYIIGGEQIYRTFLDDIERWVVTEVPLALEGADTFMPENFLSGFEPRDTVELEENLKATFYERR